MDEKERIAIALRGSALGNTLLEQMVVVKVTAKVIMDLTEEGCKVIIAHGDGPQVGMINSAVATLSREDVNQPNAPLSVYAAMSQVYIGYDLQNVLGEELSNRNIGNTFVTIMITQVRMGKSDPAFQAPSKPIGHFMATGRTKEAEERYDYTMEEDSGRGYRRVVASLKPTQIIEIGVTRSLVDSDQLVIVCGGGGISVTSKGSHLEGVSAVIDRDFISGLLAEELDTDFLIVLTVVGKAAINYGEPDVKWLSDITTDEARQYIEEGHFAPGSIFPKVQAAVKFADSKEGCTPLITLLERAKEGIQGLAGTKTHQ